MARPKKVIIEETSPKSVDYHSMPIGDVEKLIFNKIIEQALVEIPSAQVLALAAKLIGGNVKPDDSASSLQSLSTDELMIKIKGLM